MNEATSPGELLAQLETLHDALLEQLEDLDNRIRGVIKEYAPARQESRPPVVGPSPPEAQPVCPTREAA